MDFILKLMFYIIEEKEKNVQLIFKLIKFLA